MTDDNSGYNVHAPASDSGHIGGLNSSEPSGASISLSEGAEMDNYSDIDFDSDFMSDFMEDFSFSEEDGLDF